VRGTWKNQFFISLAYHREKIARKRAFPIDKRTGSLVSDPVKILTLFSAA
jgi:hypothetical protein